MNKIIPFLTGLNKVTKIFKSPTFEEKLEQSNSYLAIARKGAESGKWNWNMKSEEVNLSPNVLSILGYEKKEKVLKQNTFFDLIHPDDKSNFLYEIEKLKSDVTDYVNVNIRMKSAYGNWNWINIRGKIVEFDRNNIPLRFIGINYDINEQKQYDDDVQKLQLQVIKSQEKENKTWEENIACNSINLDRYSEFRLNGLRNLLQHN